MRYVAAGLTGPTATAWTRARCVVLASTLALAGCGENDTTASGTSRRQPPLQKEPSLQEGGVPERRRSTAPDGSRPPVPRGTRASRLETVVLARLGRVDPEATATEHAAVDDAHAQARFGRDTVQIDVYGPDLSPTGRRLRVEDYKGIATTLRRQSAATSYWSKCELLGFGRKALVLVYVDDPAQTVPEVHRALRCAADARR